MKRGMISNKKRIMMIIIMLSVVLLWVLRSNDSKIDYYPELSKEQKVEDFLQFYNTMIESIPFIEDVKAVYGIDFKARKEYYESVIARTENNAEFFAAMQAISRDLCSFHTDLCYPLYSNVKEIKCYNSRKIVKMKGMEEQQNLWFESIGEEIKKYNIENFIYVVYFDGEYVAINSEVNSVEDGDKLVSVNDIPVNDYFIENLSLGKICYDGKYEKAYRTQFTLNDNEGEAVRTVWRNQEGEEYTRELYHSLMGELVMGYGYLYEQDKDKEAYEETPTIYSYRDYTNQVEYIKIANFSNNEGEKLGDIFSNIEFETIIVDLRGNYGGSPSYFNEYIYPYLYSEKVSCDRYWKTKHSKFNNKMINNITVRLNKYFQTEQDIIYKMSDLFVGRYGGDKRNIYYLIDDGTASSADFAAMSVKKYNLGTLVGENTRGEGGGQSYICDKLGNSGLVFIYYPSVSCDEKGRSLYTPGTAPDVYVSATHMDYLEKMKYSNTKYENLVQYDPLIEWIIENR